MIPYVVLIIILLICTFLEVNRVPVYSAPRKAISPKKNNGYVIFPIIVILFLGIFREITVGHDGESYYVYYWNRLDDLSWLTILTDFSEDNGFYFVLKVISLFAGDWWGARAILFSITFLLYYIAIKEDTPAASIAMIVYIGLGMLGLMFGILRQALAGAITVHAYKHIKKGSVIKCVTLIFIAATIHKSALICLYLPMLHFLKWRRFSGLKLTILSVVAFGAFSIVTPVIVSLYANSLYEGSVQSEGGYGKLIFMIVVIVLIIHMMRLTNTFQDPELSLLFNITCGALFVQVGSLYWSLLTRIAVYFSIYWCILIPKLIFKLPRGLRGKYSLIIVVLFVFMFFYQLADVEMFVMHQF